MTKIFTNTFPVINLYKKASTKSKIVTQLIYGESFTIIEKSNKWLKIKIQEDSYRGYIRYKNFLENLNPTHKIHKLKSNIYRFPNRKKKIGELTFGSKIQVNLKKNNFFKFKKGWIEKNNLKPINFKEKNFFKKIKIFKNIKYKWGGKTFEGIDCSGLVQICLKFNNKFCPRDAKDQEKYFKKKIKLNKIKKNDLIFWKGHVAVAITKKKLIHAYGPLKKTVIMDIDKTIKRIDKTANLKILSITRL